MDAVVGLRAGFLACAFPLLASAATLRSNAVHTSWGFGISVDRNAVGSIITGNNLYIGQSANHCSLANAVPGLNASGNYWGDPAGPSGPHASFACGQSTATTTPFATRPFPVTILKP